MNSSSPLPAKKLRPAREFFAGMGVPEAILAEQEKMDDIFCALFLKPGSDELPAMIDPSDWEDEEI